jgi:hypothetical protein
LDANLERLHLALGDGTDAAVAGRRRVYRVLTSGRCDSIATRAGPASRAPRESLAVRQSPSSRSWSGLPLWHSYDRTVNELVFEVVLDADGGYCAECLTESILTQGDSWDELRRNDLEAVNAFYFDGSVPARIRLHLVRDEVLSVA